MFQESASSAPSDLFLPGDAAPRDAKSRLGFTAPEPADSFRAAYAHFTSIVISSSTMSLFRHMAAPVTATEPPAASTLPKWYVERFRMASAVKTGAGNFLRDTALLVAASYLMEGVEAGMKLIRGDRDDPVNKMLGGVAGGGLVGGVWYPRQSTPRLLLTGTGALVGFMSHQLQATSKAILLRDQRKLEQELLGGEMAELTEDLDTAYLKHLLRLREKKLSELAKTAADAAGASGSPDGDMDAGFSGAVQGAVRGPTWASQAVSMRGTPASASASLPDATTGPSGDAARFGDRSQVDNFGRNAGERLRHDSQRFGSTANRAVTNGEMTILEEPDVPRGAAGFRDAPGTLIIREEEDPPPR